MAYFDRFDICAAYAALENDWNVGGILRERGRKYSVGVQLRRMGYKPSPLHQFPENKNQEEIYTAAAKRLGLVQFEPLTADQIAVRELTGFTMDPLQARRHMQQRAQLERMTLAQRRAPWPFKESHGPQEPDTAPAVFRPAADAPF